LNEKKEINLFFLKNLKKLEIIQKLSRKFIKNYLKNLEMELMFGLSMEN